MSASPHVAVGAVGAAAPPLRVMRATDLDAVQAIERRAYEQPWGHGVFLDCIGAGCECRVLERRRDVIGYALMSVGACECHLLNLCIDPRFQRRGHGRRLLRRMLGIAAGRGVARAILEVSVTNPSAMQLYLSEGFNRIGRRRNYYPSSHGREDAVVLARLL